MLLEDVRHVGFDPGVELDDDLEGGKGGQVDADGRSHGLIDHSLNVSAVAKKQNRGLSEDSVISCAGVEVAHVEREYHPGDAC